MAQNQTSTPLIRANEAEVKRITDEIDVLVDRLDVGATRIDIARKAGRDVTAAEDKWVGLLHDYEKLCDRRRALGYVQNQE